MVEKDEEKVVVSEEEKKSKKESLLKAKVEEDEILTSLSEAKYQNLVSDCYTQMDSHIDLVCKGISTGAIIEGSPGTGKTYRALNHALKSVGKNDVAYADSFTTPQQFYAWLYQNRYKRVIILDDIAGLMSNQKVLAFLKGALWDVNGQRVIAYMTSKHIMTEEGITVPMRFDFEAGIIIITNQLNMKNPHVKAVLSRVNYCKVEVPRDELLSILEQISKQSYSDLEDDERKEVFDYLRDNSSESNLDLNIRTLLKMFQFKIYSKMINNPDLWKTLSLKLLEKDDRLVLVESLVKDDSYQNEEERVSKFIELTGFSRPTYFRLKEKLEV